MGNSFVLFDVSIVISHGQFHCGNRGHTQNTDFPWVKFPVGKRSSGTPAIVSFLFMDGNGWRDAAFIVYFSHDMDTWFVLSRYSVLQLESEYVNQLGFISGTTNLSR